MWPREESNRAGNVGRIAQSRISLYDAHCPEYLIDGIRVIAGFCAAGGASSGNLCSQSFVDETVNRAVSRGGQPIDLVNDFIR